MKFIWQPRTHFTTFSNIKQVDADRIVMYRRSEIFNSDFQTWEQIIINRQNNTIESALVGPNPDGSMYIVERNLYRPAGKGDL